MTEVVIGVDFGSSSVKAIAYDVTGRIRGKGRAATPVTRTQAGLDFPVERILVAARSALRQAGSDHQVAGVGLTSMGEVGAVLGRGQELQATSFPAWHDPRGAEVVAAVEGTCGSSTNGLTGGHLRPTSTLAKLGWLQSRGQPLMGTFLGLCGLLAYQWTGEQWQESSLAATSGAFNPVTGEWLPEVWAAAGIAAVGLPTIYPPASSVSASQAPATEDGITGSLIVIAGHDHPVAAVGTGAAPGSVVDSLGTGEPVLAAWTGARPTPAEAVSLVGKGLTIETWPSTGDPLLIWEGLRPGLAMETLLIAAGIPRAELEGSPARGVHPPAPFDRAECMALERGEQEPLRRRDLLNASPSSWRLAWHELLDAYARDAANGESAVRAATGASGPVILTGGGIRSTLWVDKKLHRTTSALQVSPITETGTRGAAALAGVALNWWKDASLMPHEDNE